MKEIWQNIEDWLKINATEVYEDLIPGATDQEIAQAEEIMQIKFPDIVLQSLKIHNGQVSSPYLIGGDWNLLNLEYMVNRWKFLKELFDAGDFDLDGTEMDAPPEIRKEWWNPKWVPISSNGSGDYYCIDLNPTEQGNLGQIISYWHVDTRRELIAKDFKEWLDTFAKDLDKGKYSYNT
jgi:cell wall assembly regulator SMI1